MNRYLPILVFCILANVVGDNSILRMFNTQKPLIALILSTGMIGLQILSAPIQAGFSDFYCRKKSLIVSLTFSCLGLIILVFFKSRNLLSIFPLIVVLVMNGMFGNTIPLAWGALADTQKKNLRFSLALTTGAYSIAYMVLATSNLYNVTTAFWSFIIAGAFVGILFAYLMIKVLHLR
jgi:MFS family permease